jgi:hypothetical protein
MFGTEYTRERIRDAAAKHFADNDDAAVAQLWGKVITAFDQWKQEHGNRKPKAFRGMLSDVLGPKPIPFKKAAPWQCADLLTPSPLALAYKLIGEEYSPFIAVTNEAGISKVLALLIIGFADDTSDDELFTAHEILIEHATNKKWLTIEAVKEWKIRANLRKGTIAAAEERTKNATIRNAPLITDIQNVLSENPQWTSQRITNHLLKGGNPYGKTPLTILADVKAEKAKYRKANS